MTVGPDVWPVSYAQSSQDRADRVWGAMSAADRSVIETAAIELLWRWTGRVYGLVPFTLRPARRPCAEGIGSSAWWPLYLTGGRELTVRCWRCYRSVYRPEAGCGCASTAAIQLAGPVHDITSVQINADVLAPSAYRLDHGSILVRVDGDLWPAWQNLDAPLGASGHSTWQVEGRHGLEVPAGGRVAAGELAVELAMSRVDPSACQLPQRLQTITRQGVSMTLVDGMADLDKGRTGIWSVDSWVVSVTRTRAAATVRSVDVPRDRLTRP